VQLAGTIAHPLHSEIVLIHVINTHDEHPDTAADILSNAADLAEDRRNLLRNAAKRFLPANVKFDVRILTGDPLSIALAEAKNLDADLMIITTHPLTATGFPFSRGRARQIVHRALCPVLTIQVPDEQEPPDTVWEASTLRPHNLHQYCEFSRLLSREGIHRPTYTGYSHTSSGLLGGCH
jgi:nucleotide-binding universal stress UspA family protein